VEAQLIAEGAGRDLNGDRQPDAVGGSSERRARKTVTHGPGGTVGFKVLTKKKMISCIPFVSAKMSAKNDVSIYFL
jgi:hypothetical protein